MRECMKFVAQAYPGWTLFCVFVTIMVIIQGCVEVLNGWSARVG